MIVPGAALEGAIQPALPDAEEMYVRVPVPLPAIPAVLQAVKRIVQRIVMIRAS
jgi:hypothetical protein